VLRAAVVGDGLGGRVSSIRMPGRRRAGDCERRHEEEAPRARVARGLEHIGRAVAICRHELGGIAGRDFPATGTRRPAGAAPPRNAPLRPGRLAPADGVTQPAAPQARLSHQRGDGVARARSAFDQGAPTKPVPPVTKTFTAACRRRVGLGNGSRVRRALFMRALSSRSSRPSPRACPCLTEFSHVRWYSTASWRGAKLRNTPSR